MMTLSAATAKLKPDYNNWHAKLQYETYRNLGIRKAGQCMGSLCFTESPIFLACPFLIFCFVFMSS